MTQGQSGAWGNTLGDDGPDVLLAGFARSGTTLLAHLLAGHPGIAVAGLAPPEPKVLLQWTGRVEEARAAYARAFSDAPFGSLRVDKSTSYSDHPQSFPLAAALLPTARWVFVVRDPVDRLLSNFHWSVMNGRENRSLRSMLTDLARPDLGLPAEPRPHDYLWRSLYGRLLRNWSRYVPPEHGHVVQLEQLVADPAQTLDSLASFLGLDERIPVPDNLPVINAATSAEIADVEDLLTPLARNVLGPDIDTLTSTWTHIDPLRWVRWHALTSTPTGR